MYSSSGNKAKQSKVKKKKKHIKMYTDRKRLYSSCGNKTKQIKAKEKQKTKRNKTRLKQNKNV